MKILLQIKDGKLYFKIKKRLSTDEKNIMNTNVISDSELVFSYEYIESNIKLVHNFIKELAKEYNINSIVIRESSIAPIIIHICSNISSIKYLYLREESILTYKIADKIIKSNNIKYVSLYSLPTYLLEMFDKENIKIDSSSEMFFTSEFMKQNKLDTFSSLYYKKNINLTFPMNEADYEEFESFIKINNYLKTIYVNTLYKEDVEKILKILYKNRLKNITIYIKENIQDIELANYLKTINKKNEKINGIRFRIEYSEDYIENNLITQIELNTIKICVFLVLAFLLALIIFVITSNYSSKKKVDVIQDEIIEIQKKHEEENNNNNGKEIVIENEEEENNTKPKKPEEKYNNDVTSLLEINEDTVGWLKVNNTGVDYPVVQYLDNDFYLKRNFKGSKDSSGWIFMDYRSDAKNLSKNTIIYGHNMYYTGIMFGTLYKTKYKDWYTDTNNQIIEFDTTSEKLQWKIFSIYVIPNTNDYLYVNFKTDDDFQSFLNLITDRSIYDFNTPVSVNDKILTLSTCSGNGQKRHVIHAVLLENENTTE